MQTRAGRSSVPLRSTRDGFDQEKGRNPYSGSIDAVGIGAFPLLPEQENLWLFDFLKSQLGDASADEIYEVIEADELYIQESIRIAPYGLKQYRHRDLVLCASVPFDRTKGYLGGFIKGTAKWYHLPVSHTKNRRISRHIIRETGYCVVTVKEAGAVRSCEFIYPIESAEIRYRKDIPPEIAGISKSIRMDEQYWLLKLGKAERLPRPVPRQKRSCLFDMRLADKADLLNASHWEDIPRSLSDSH